MNNDVALLFLSEPSTKATVKLVGPTCKHRTTAPDSVGLDLPHKRHALTVSLTKSAFPLADKPALPAPVNSTATVIGWGYTKYRGSVEADDLPLQMVR